MNRVPITIYEHIHTFRARSSEPREHIKRLVREVVQGTAPVSWAVPYIVEDISVWLPCVAPELALTLFGSAFVVVAVLVIDRYRWKPTYRNSSGAGARRTVANSAHGLFAVVLTQNTVPSIIDGKSHRVALFYSIYQGDSGRSISSMS